MKTPAQIERMHVTGAFVGDVLEQLASAAGVGVNLLDLEHRARELIAARGAKSCYWDYAPSFGRGPFRNVACISVNDAALHGLPHDYHLQDGDVVSIDLAVAIDGWAADSALTVIVGAADRADSHLVRATQLALEAAIAAAQPGHRMGDISAAVEAVATEHGYGVNREFGGHGIGRTMHEDPHVANHGRPGRGLRLKPGLTLALEPWFMATTDQLRVDSDGWTLRSADGSRASHSEHTIAVTDEGPVVLTRRESETAGR